MKPERKPQQRESSVHCRISPQKVRGKFKYSLRKGPELGVQRTPHLRRAPTGLLSPTTMEPPFPSHHVSRHSNSPFKNSGFVLWAGRRDLLRRSSVPYSNEYASSSLLESRAAALQIPWRPLLERAAKAQEGIPAQQLKRRVWGHGTHPFERPLIERKEGQRPALVVTISKHQPKDDY